MASRNNDVLHSCEVCGQDGLREEELLSHMKKVHVDGAVQCPFCDLSSNELTSSEMALHVNSVHLEYLTPEREVGGGFSEFDDDFESIWQLEKQAQEGMSCGIGVSPIEEQKPGLKESSKPDSNKFDEANHNSPNKGKVDPYLEKARPSPTLQTDQQIAAIGGAIQKRLRNSSSDSSPSRSSLKLEFKAPRLNLAQEEPSLEQYQCPMCNHQEIDVDRLQNHVNISHFDLSSPNPASKPRPSEPHSTSPSCPICFSTSFASVMELEKHINVEHGDILSPDETPKKQPAAQKQQPGPSLQLVCPVCNSATFNNENQLVDHIETHFSSEPQTTVALPSTSKASAENSVVTPPVKKKVTHHSFKHLTNRNSFSFASLSSSSSSSSRSSVFSTASKSSDTSSNDQLHSDFLLAQELARREHEKRKHEEQKEFDQLRAQFGMDNEGNYRQQSLSNMQKAVYKGEMSVVDYYEMQVNLKQSEQSGADEGHSVTFNAIPRLKSLCQQTPQVSQVYLCSAVDHHASSYGDKGWGCGYRNLQMLLSSLQSCTEYSNRLSSVLTGKTSGIPSILRLQGLIEEAWARGFDVQGRDQLGGQLSNTRKWIGATEIVAFLTSQQIQSELIDFHQPSGKDGSHPRLFQWVLNYFKENMQAQQFTPPLYLQHQGHSRTIVGIEVLSNDSQLRLLIFDPSHSRNQMSALTSGGKNENSTSTALRMLRKTMGTIKSKQYQIVAVRGTFNSEREAASHRIIQSRRIP